MSATETGIYITLIAIMYDRGTPIPADISRLARLCGASNSQFKRALDALVSEGKIHLIDGALWNDRVEKETVYRSEKSAVAKQAAEMRWQKSVINQGATDAPALRPQCDGNAISEVRSQKSEVREDHPSDDLFAPSDETLDAAPLLTDDPIVCLIPTNTGNEFPIRASKVQEYQTTYLGVDVETELRKIRQWSIDNPKRRKTANGVLRAVNTWLSKAQDRGPPTARGSPRAAFQDPEQFKILKVV